MAPSAAVLGRRSPPLNLRLVLAIFWRSSAAFFSPSVLAPLLLSALLLFLFRYALLALTFQYTSFLKNDPSIRYLLLSALPSSLDVDVINGTHNFSPFHLSFAAPLQNYPQHHQDLSGVPPFFSYTNPVLMTYCFSFLFPFACQGYYLLYSTLHPTALIAVFTSHYLNKPLPRRSAVTTFRHGASLGCSHQLQHLLSLWLLARHMLVLFISPVFTAINNAGDDIVDKFGANTEMSLAPFTAPLFVVSDMGFSDLVLVWGVLDSVLSLLWVLVPWVVLFEYQPNYMARMRFIDLVDVVKQGCRLLWLMPFKAFTIKMLEARACGELGRRGLVMIGCGSGLLAGIIQSVFEAYFVVVWLVFYLAARCRDAESKGRTFGVQDLEDCLARLR